MTFFPNWKQNMGIMLKEEERRLQPRKEINNEWCRLKYQVLFSVGILDVGEVQSFFCAAGLDCVCINLL